MNLYVCIRGNQFFCLRALVFMYNTKKRDCISILKGKLKILDNIQGEEFAPNIVFYSVYYNFLSIQIKPGIGNIYSKHEKILP